MNTNQDSHRTISDRVADLLPHLEAADFGDWLESMENVSPDHFTPLESTAEDNCEPMPSTVEVIECFRSTTTLASEHMSVSEYSGYESAPESAKRVIEALFDPELREGLFAHILAESDEYDRDDGGKSGQNYLEHLYSQSAR